MLLAVLGDVSLLVHLGLEIGTRLIGSRMHPPHHGCSGALSQGGNESKYSKRLEHMMVTQNLQLAFKGPRRAAGGVFWERLLGVGGIGGAL